MLWSPEAHEELSGEPWSADSMRAAITAIADETQAAFDDGWQTHPLDVEAPGEADTRFRTLYLGGAGVVAALQSLADRGLASVTRDYVPYLERSIAAPSDFPGYDVVRSLMSGEAGVRLVLQRLAPSNANVARLAQLIDANAQDDRLDLMSGSPGTILAGRELGIDVTPSMDWLREQRDDDGLWTQHVGGKHLRVLGAAHGFSGCALALGEDASDTLARNAVTEGGLVNWPGVADTRLDANRDGQIRVQWCHGAPGVVATLEGLLDDELALAGAELTWRAGPLRKGGGLCHGTAGNGYALLSAFERTQDERWLTRARGFAMHAAAQVELSRRAHGRGRFTLWTGDLGTALYLAACVDGGGRLPIPLP